MASLLSRLRTTHEQLTALGVTDAHTTRAFLERDVVVNLFALSWMENYGISATRRGVFRFMGVRDEEGLHAVALIVGERLILLESDADEHAAAIGRALADTMRRSAAPDDRLHHVVARDTLAESFWTGYTSRNARLRHPLRARLVSPQQMFCITREDWLATRGDPLQAELLSDLRAAQLSELDAVFLASAHMHREETLEDPLEDRPTHFRNHVAHRIKNGRSFAWFDDHRRLVFKVDISAQSRYGVQLSGVYTRPDMRGQGIATRGMIDMCRILFARGIPRVTLYVNEHNLAAQTVYDRVGFTPHADYKTIFVATT